METWATKEGFFKCPVPRERKTVPGLGDIWIYGLTNAEKDDYEDKVISVRAGSRQVKLKNARAVLMSLVVFDKNGKRMFGEADIGRLLLVPAFVTDPVLDIARRLSGMRTGEEEELVKNSAGPGDEESGSGSESPKPGDGR